MAGIIPRIRTITDDTARAAAQAYRNRAAGKVGPITINELPEDVAVNLVKSVETIAPKSVRSKLVSKLRNKKYALAAGGAITGGALLATSDVDFIDAILSLTPDAIESLVADVVQTGGDAGSDVAYATQQVGDAAFAHQVVDQDTSGHLRMRPVDQSVGGLGVSLDEVERLQALTDVMELALRGLGSHDVVEAVIFLANNTSAKDRQVLMDNLRYARGY